MTETPKKFNSVGKTITVEIDDKTYTLKEASGAAVNAYNDNMMAGTTLGPDGKPQSITGLGGADTLLLSYCFFDSNMKLVGGPKIKQWPHRIQKYLIDQLTEISELKNTSSTEREMILKALKRSDSPVSLDVFRNWVNTLVKEDKEFKVLSDLVKPDLEETVKND